MEREQGMKKMRLVDGERQPQPQQQQKASGPNNFMGIAVVPAAAVLGAPLLPCAAAAPPQRAAKPVKGAPPPAREEALYDDDPAARAAAAARIAAAFARTDKVAELVSHASLLPTLARLLREDGRRSLDLAAAIAAVFLPVSAARHLHGALAELGVGAALLGLAQLEVARTAQRAAGSGPASTPVAVVARLAAANLGCVDTRDDEDARDAGLLRRQLRFLLPTLGVLSNLAEDPNTQRKMVKRELPALLVALLGFPSLQMAVASLDLLRRTAVYTEAKSRILAAGAAPRALAFLSPSAPAPLQVAAARLLTNLAFDARARGELVRLGLAPRAAAVVLAAAGQPVDAAAGAAALPALALGLAYLASIEPDGRVALAATPGLLPWLLDAMARADDLRAHPELIALIVNVCHEPAAAQWFAAGNRLERAVQRALRGGGGGDELALKALRALASSGNAALAAKLAGHAPGLVALLQAPRGASADAQTEVLGVLAAAFDKATGACCADADAAAAGQAAAIAGGKSAAESEWDAALASTRAVRAVAACLASPIGDDALLEAVALIGSIAGRQAMAKQLAESGALSTLVVLMTERCHDDEFVLQAAWALARAMTQRPTRAFLLSAGGQSDGAAASPPPALAPAPAVLADLAADACGAIRAAAAAGLDAAIDAGGDDGGSGGDVGGATAAGGSGWASHLRALRFEAHNQAWLAAALHEPAAELMEEDRWQQQQQQQQETQEEEQQQQQEALYTQTEPPPRNSSETGGNGPREPKRQQRRGPSIVGRRSAKVVGEAAAAGLQGDDAVDETFGDGCALGAAAAAAAGGGRVVVDVEGYCCRGHDDGGDGDEDALRQPAAAAAAAAAAAFEGGGDGPSTADEEAGSLNAAGDATTAEALFGFGAFS